MMVASSVENVWLPDVDCNSVKEQITNALWLSSGANGMKVWLTLAGPVRQLQNICYSFNEDHSFVSTINKYIKASNVSSLNRKAYKHTASCQEGTCYHLI